MPLCTLGTLICPHVAFWKFGKVCFLPSRQHFSKTTNSLFVIVLIYARKSPREKYDDNFTLIIYWTFYLFFVLGFVSCIIVVNSSCGLENRKTQKKYLQVLHWRLKSFIFRYKPLSSCFRLFCGVYSVRSGWTNMQLDLSLHFQVLYHSLLSAKPNKVPFYR